MVLSRGNTLDLCRDVPRIGRSRSEHPALSRLLRAGPAPGSGRRTDGREVRTDSMIRQLDDRTLVSGQVAPQEVAGAGGAGRHHAGQQSARRRRAGSAACSGNGRGGRCRRASPTASCRSCAASARPTSRRCRRRCAKRATARCSPSAARARVPRSPARSRSAGRAYRARMSSNGCRKAGFDLRPDRAPALEQALRLPAAISSGRGARPRIALRCGKRPKRAMISWCFLA